MQQKKDEGYQLIRFVLIWTIVVQHVLTTASENGIPKPYLLEAVFYRLSGCFGQLAVSLFFMLSGALLWKNHRTAENPAAFYWKHIIKILLPIWICSVPLILLDYMRDPGLFTSAYFRSTVFYNLFGVDLYLWVFKHTYPYHVCGEWFTSVILTVYLLFPLLRAAFQRKGIRIISTGIITVLFFLNLRFPVMTMGDGWYSFTRGIFFFWMGMIFEEHRDVLDRRSTALFAFAGFAAVYFFQYQRMLGSVFLPNILASLCSFPVLYRLGIEADALLSRPFFARMIDGTCNKNYLIYLCHHFLIMLFMPLLLDSNTNAFRFCLFIAFSIIISYGCAAMTSPIVKALTQKAFAFKEKDKIRCNAEQP